MAHCKQLLWPEEGISILVLLWPVHGSLMPQHLLGSSAVPWYLVLNFKWSHSSSWLVGKKGGGGGGVRKWIKILSDFLLLCQYPFVSRITFELKYLLPSQVLLLVDFRPPLATCCALVPRVLNLGSEFQFLHRWA